MRWVGWSFLVLFLASGSVPVALGASCAAPDRCYASSQTIEDSVAVVNGDVTVQSGARLTLRDSDLVLRGSPGRTLTVEPGATLVLDGGRVRGELAPFHLVVHGTLEGRAGHVQMAQDLRVVDGGRVLWEAGSLAFADGIHTAAGTLLDVARASVVSNDADASNVLGGATKLVATAWNGTGTVRWTGALDASGLVARGPSFSCVGTTFDVRDSDLRAPGATALSTLQCSGLLARTRIDGRDGWVSRQDGDIDALALDARASLGRAVDVAGGGPVTLDDSRLASHAQPALEVGALGDVLARRIDAASNTSAALRCHGGNVAVVGGSLRGSAGASLAGCTGTLQDLALAGRAAAVRWDNKPAGGPAVTQAVTLRNLSFTNVTGGGDGIPFAYDLRVTGNAEGLRSAVAPLGLLRWEAASAAQDRLANLTAAGGACAIELSAGSFQASNVTAATGSKAVCAKSAVLALSSSDLRAADVPLTLDASTATLMDTHLNATRDVLRGGSTIVASRAFAPQAAYKNLAPASGATVVVRKLDNTTLATGTAGADGRATPVVIEVFRQDAATLVRAPDLRVRASLAGLSNETRLAADAHPLRALLRDDVAPNATSAVRRLPATLPSVKLEWNAAADDHGAPLYEVLLRSQPGSKALLPNGTALAIDDPKTIATTAAQLTLPGQGRYWLNVTPVDRSGNRGPSRGLDVVWDTGLPAVKVALDGPSSPSGWFRGPVKVLVNATDRESGIASTTVASGGVAVAGGILDATGVHALQVLVRDHAGNQAQSNQTVRIDREAPTPMAVTLAQGRAAGAVNALVVQKPSDAHAGITEVLVWFDAEGARTRVDTLVAPFPDALPIVLPSLGAGTIVLETVDAAGNSASSAPVAVAALPSGGVIKVRADEAASRDAPGLGLMWTMAAALLALAVRRTTFMR